jgi:hypothetical protein
MKVKSIYIARDVTDLMLAVGAKKTTVKHGYAHYCREHKTMVTWEHAQRCTLL